MRNVEYVHDQQTIVWEITSDEIAEDIFNNVSQRFGDYRVSSH